MVGRIFAPAQDHLNARHRLAGEGVANNAFQAGDRRHCLPGEKTGSQRHSHKDANCFAHVSSYTPGADGGTFQFAYKNLPEAVADAPA